MSEVNHVKLSKLVEKVQKWNPKNDAPSKNFTYIDISSINRDSKQISDATEILGGEAPSRARQLVKQDDVLVSTVRPNLNAVAQISEDFDGSTASTGYCVLRPKKDVLDSGYLFHWVRTPVFVEMMVQQATGASYPAVNDTIVKASEVPLPELGEQRRIAAVLDKADALRQKRRTALAKLDTLLQATFVHMFGDPVTNPMGWETYSMKDLVIDGPQNGLYRPSSDYGSGNPIIRIDSFYNGKVIGLEQLKRVRIEENVIEKYSVYENDILINRVNSREYLGKSAIVPKLEEPTVFESNMMRMTVDKNLILPDFLVAQMQHEYIKMQILSRCKDAVNQSSINQGDVLSFELRVPPLQKQKFFISAIKKLEKNQSGYLLSAAALDNLFHALQQRAFNGRL